MHLYLEILVSLIGLFIIFSIINSLVVEWVADMINARGRFLKSKIFSFFEPVKEGNLKSTAREIFTMEDRKQETEKFNAADDHIGRKLYAHPLIQSTFKSRYRWPSFIDANIFSEALLGILKPYIDDYDPNTDIEQSPVFKSLPEGLKKALTTILAKAEEVATEKLVFVQNEIEKLYDAYMLRVKLWYKQRVRLWLFLFGTLGAFMFNLDTVNIFGKFQVDGQLRREYYKTAVALDEKRDEIMADTTKMYALLDLAARDQDKRDSVLQVMVNDIISTGDEKANLDLTALDIGFLKYKHNLVAFLGTLLTGIALSFGSTFWFDLLRQFLRFGKTDI